MQENLSQLVFWDHCPSLSFPLSFAPQGCSLSALTEGFSCSFKPRTFPPCCPLPGRQLAKGGKDATGAPSSSKGRIQQSSHHPVTFHLQGNFQFFGIKAVPWCPGSGKEPGSGSHSALGSSCCRGTDHPTSTPQ